MTAPALSRATNCRGRVSDFRIDAIVHAAQIGPHGFGRGLDADRRDGQAPPQVLKEHPDIAKVVVEGHADNATAKGREANRRVEMVIVH